MVCGFDLGRAAPPLVSPRLLTNTSSSPLTSDSADLGIGPSLPSWAASSYKSLPKRQLPSTMFHKIWAHAAHPTFQLPRAMFYKRARLTKGRRGRK